MSMDAGSVSSLLAIVLALTILDFLLWRRLRRLQREHRAAKAERVPVDPLPASTER